MIYRRSIMLRKRKLLKLEQLKPRIHKLKMVLKEKLSNLKLKRIKMRKRMTKRMTKPMIKRMTKPMIKSQIIKRRMLRQRSIHLNKNILLKSQSTNKKKRKARIQKMIKPLLQSHLSMFKRKRENTPNIMRTIRSQNTYKNQSPTQ